MKEEEGSITVSASTSTVPPSVPVWSSSAANKQIYVQVINDLEGKTLVAAASNDKALAAETKGKNGIDTAAIVGKAIAERALAAGITKVAFDRGGYLFHGRVKSLADAAREGGLVF